MIRKLSILLILLVCGSLTAHEFWLEPQKFRLKKGETLKVRFRVGENFEGGNWQGNRQFVDKIHLFYNGIEDDLTELISDDAPGDSLSLQFFDEGTGVLSFQSTNRRIELEPSKFLEYLKEDGLDEAIAYREQHNETDSAGKEYYQRSVKTIFQVGAVYDDTYKKACGLPLELMPLHNPYHLKKGQKIGLRLMLRNEPVAGAKVKVWHRMNGKTTMDALTTNDEGIISFTPVLSGRYMVSSVTMEHIDSSANTNWQSYWSSLTWGY